MPSIASRPARRLTAGRPGFVLHVPVPGAVYNLPSTMACKLTTDLDDPEGVPYFLWDQPMPLQALRQKLSCAPPAERAYLLGKIMREARDTDVWRFTSPDEVNRIWDDLSVHLGRRRAFWKFLLDHWKKDGLVDG